jgi:hypothetical protein
MLPFSMHFCGDSRVCHREPVTLRKSDPCAASNNPIGQHFPSKANLKLLRDREEFVKNRLGRFGADIGNDRWNLK